MLSSPKSDVAGEMGISKVGCVRLKWCGVSDERAVIGGVLLTVAAE